MHGIPEGNTVGGILAHAHDRLHLCHGTEGAKAITRAWLQERLQLALPELDQQLVIDPGPLRRLLQDLDRLTAGEPLQYVLGQVHFHGLDLAVDPRVLIPRPETEELVDLIIRSLTFDPRAIVDVGTGSGCIALALKRAFPRASVMGIDASADALDVARANGISNGLTVEWALVDALGTGLVPRFAKAFSAPGNVVVSNPPYVPLRDKAGMEPHVVDHEPHLALFVADADPHIFYRAIASAAATTMNQGDELWFEGHYLQLPQTAQVVKQAGFANPLMIDDLSGNHRFIRACK
ncbi:MAG: peptide chain release factor N(5)-glutamine methyltransferase [Flavobacteriales bacterium]|nr:peptide chain release factor N(5)-glutamine methyltransferase [Flavobacteriales bacterium]MBP9081140.1 peptide chain release factor N(5)-glutamine methyltransferase [Flavobacteriales bacterium]